MIRVLRADSAESIAHCASILDQTASKCMKIACCADMSFAIKLVLHLKACNSITKPTWNLVVA